MCIGIPMQVVKSGEYDAVCSHHGNLVAIDVRLVETVKEGDWVLTFLGAAREILEEAQAQKINHALQALDDVLHGKSDIDHLFADLAERPPQLPDFLKPTQAKETS